MRIISRAFNLTDDRVSGPEWINSECYDIRAKAASNQSSEQDLMSMLQNLLNERFQLEAHYQKGARPVFNLVIDGGGVKMRPDGENVSVPPRAEGQILFMAKTLHDLCERLGKVAGRPVVDKTGLHGKYVIVLTYSRGLTGGAAADAAALPEPSSDIFSAVRDQLGLRLVAGREPVDVLKIDKVEKIPTAN